MPSPRFVGIPEPTKRGDGMGLHNMQYRASMIHGSFDVRSAEQGGTTIVCQFATNRVG